VCRAQLNRRICNVIVAIRAIFNPSQTRTTTPPGNEDVGDEEETPSTPDSSTPPTNDDIGDEEVAGDEEESTGRIIGGCCKRIFGVCTARYIGGRCRGLQR